MTNLAKWPARRITPRAGVAALLIVTLAPPAIANEKKTKLAPQLRAALNDACGRRGNEFLSPTANSAEPGKGWGGSLNGFLKKMNSRQAELGIPSSWKPADAAPLRSLIKSRQREFKARCTDLYVGVLSPCLHHAYGSDEFGACIDTLDFPMMCAKFKAPWLFLSEVTTGDDAFLPGVALKVLAGVGCR